MDLVMVDVCSSRKERYDTFKASFEVVVMVCDVQGSEAKKEAKPKDTFARDKAKLIHYHFYYFEVYLIEPKMYQSLRVPYMFHITFHYPQ